MLLVRNCIGKKKIDKIKNEVFLSMVKKKEKVKKEEKEDFDLQIALKDINPLLREGFERFILKFNLQIKSQKQFDDLLKEYGG